MFYIDTHAHLCKEYYPDTFEEVVQRSVEAHVTQIILPGVNASGQAGLLEAADCFPAHLFPLVGLHPTDVFENYREELDLLKEFLKDPRIIGIGEIGMDLYHDKTFLAQQREAFYMQLEWARDLQLPLSLHIRNAYEDSIEILKQFADCGLKGVLHCFSGGIQEAEWAIQFGFVLGIGGVVTFKNSKLQEIVKAVGLQHIVLETDAPFLAPVPFRGKINESTYIPLIADKIASIFEISTEEVMRATTDTARKIFAKLP